MVRAALLGNDVVIRVSYEVISISTCMAFYINHVTTRNFCRAGNYLIINHNNYYDIITMLLLSRNRTCYPRCDDNCNIALALQ